MKARTIEEVLYKTPFQPFLIDYDGKPVRVDHPEQVMFNKSRTVLICVSADDHIHILDVGHIKGLTLSPRRRKDA